MAAGLGLLTKDVLLTYIGRWPGDNHVKIQFGHHLRGTGKGTGNLREMYRREV